jgi:hypothetical protein
MILGVEKSITSNRRWEMIGHHCISVKVKRIPPSNLSQSIEEGSKITVTRKYLLAVVSPRHHMAEQPRCMYAGMA